MFKLDYVKTTAKWLVLMQTSTSYHWSAFVLFVRFLSQICIDVHRFFL